MTRLWRKEFPQSKEQRLQIFMKMATDKLENINKYIKTFRITNYWRIDGFDGRRCKFRKEVHHCTWSVNKVKWTKGDTVKRKSYCSSYSYTVITFKVVSITNQSINAMFESPDCSYLHINKTMCQIKIDIFRI